MASKFQMQAKDSFDGSLVTWRSTFADWTGVGFPGLVGTPLDIAVSGGGIDDGTELVPDNAMTFEDGSYVVFEDGSYATTE